jgi:hypothetical protein
MEPHLRWLAPVRAVVPHYYYNYYSLKELRHGFHYYRTATNASNCLRFTKLVLGAWHIITTRFDAEDESQYVNNSLHKIAFI